MTKMKVIFLCGEQSPWGIAHLEPLLNEPRFNVVAIVMATQERWSVFRTALSGGEHRTLTWRAKVKQLIKRLFLLVKLFDNSQKVISIAKRHEIPVIYCDDVNRDAVIASFKEFESDLLFSAAYPQILKSELLSAFPEGSFNSHPSLLPRCRGAHPVFWAIASGETRSGATIHEMTVDLDEGDIVAQTLVELHASDTRSQLYSKIINTIPELLKQFADFLTNPDILPIPQNDNEATYFRNDRKIHRRIFWDKMTATQIYNLVRACEGSAYFWVGNAQVFVRRVEIVTSNRNLTNNVQVPEGAVVDLQDGVPVVMTCNGLVRLMEMQGERFVRTYFGLGNILS